MTTSLGSAVRVEVKPVDKCHALARLGQDHVAQGRVKEGIQCLEAAQSEGTDDFETLSIVYSQLGNAYFKDGQFEKALESHRHDYQLSRYTQDGLGVVMAVGNLAHTLRALGNYPAAIVCGQRQLNGAQKLGHQSLECRANMALGIIYHLQGRELSRVIEFKDPFGPTEEEAVRELPQDAQEAWTNAVLYLEQAKDLAEKTNDMDVLGRALGNLGLTHFWRGQIQHALMYHQEFLAHVRGLGHKSHARRAHINIANCYAFVNDFPNALKHFQLALSLASELGERAAEAQCHYHIGSTRLAQGHADTAAKAFHQHLRISRELGDTVGEARSAWCLSTCYVAAKGDPEAWPGARKRALYFGMLHAHLSAKIEDAGGVHKARDALKELGDLRDADPSDDPQPTVPLQDLIEESSGPAPLPPPRRRRDGGAEESEEEAAAGPSAAVQRTPAEPEDFLVLLDRANARSIDSQRAPMSEDKENRPRRQADAPRSGRGGDSSPEDFLDLVANIQGRRIDDQRAALPFLPGLQRPERLAAAAAAVAAEEAAAGPSAANEEDFFDMLVRCQSARIDGQRSELGTPGPSGSAEGGVAQSLPEGDIFSEIMRHQQRRIDEQRGVLSPSRSMASLSEEAGGSASAKSSPDAAFKQPHKRTASHKIKKR